jgi:Zn-dependent membrane protease YugP
LGDDNLFWDSSYILVILGVIICAIASANVKSTFNKFNRYRNARGATAQDVAINILHNAGIYDVRVERIRGNLTDHYSPKEKVLRLSDSVYNSTSIGAIGVAAHECGHAIQHQEGYFPIRLRALSVPIANIGSLFYWPLILIGLLLGYMELAQVGVLLFSFVVAFQLITLPVEFNASKRALNILSATGTLTADELTGAKKVLNSAALTYVAALFSSILQLLRLLLLTQRRNNRD